MAQSPLNSFSIHAHFYQPPRENPLTGLVPREVGAAPYANWNERIHAECYRPNAELGNFEQISFNFGPTLFSWMNAYDPAICRKIVSQDQANLHRHGVGNAMAQAYNHTILPLSSYTDKVTQIYWGIADFKHYFGHRPLGMWLPETAADTETLEILARQGIRYTILAPWQAEGGEVDPTEAYSIKLTSHHELSVFFYQKELSARISFDPGSTIDADAFALRNIPASYQPEKSKRSEPQLLLIASDGELYGHHQRLRDRFLARLVDGAGSAAGLQATYPALWEREHPPRQSFTLKEGTSWSCHHGVGRWNGGCPCTPGEGEWKARLRYAFERLSAELDHLYLDASRRLVDDPWLLRDRYIHVILGESRLGELVFQLTGEHPATNQLRRLSLLLEAQRERQRMFTSCGWFFEDFDRIEPKNNVAYAAQAVHLARLATGVDLSETILYDLHRVASARSALRADQVFQAHLDQAAHQPIPGEALRL